MTFSPPPSPSAFPYDEPLRQRMAQAQIPSYRALSHQAGVSRSSLNQLRKGQADQIRLGTAQRLSQTLGVSIADLIAQFTDSGTNPESAAAAPATSQPVADPAATIAALRQEYDRLQQQMAHQEQALRQQVQREALTVIESWLVMWPNATQAAQDKPDLHASKIIPLTRPLQELLQTWAVQPIGSVGATVAYDPHLHQANAPLQSGQPVRIRHVGYWHGNRLLRRAEVVAIPQSGQ